MPWSTLYLHKVSSPLSYLDEIWKMDEKFKACLVFWAATEMQPRSEIIIEVNLDQGEEDMGRGQGENVPLLSLFLMVYFELKFLLSIFLEKSKTLSEQWLIMSPLWFFIVESKATHVFASLLLFPYLHCLRLVLPKYSISPKNCKESYLACELTSEPAMVTQMLRKTWGPWWDTRTLLSQQATWALWLYAPLANQATCRHSAHRIICGTAEKKQVAQLCLTLCDPKDSSTPGFPVHHKLPEFTQTHVHWVSDAIQPSYPLLPPSPPAFNLSQHQSLFKWLSFLHQVAKVLEFQFQHESFQWTPRTDLL